MTFFLFKFNENMRKNFSKLAQTFKKQSNLGKIIILGFFLLIVLSSPLWGLLLLLLLLSLIPLIFGSGLAFIISKAKTNHKIIKTFIIVSVAWLSLLLEISWAKEIFSGTNVKNETKEAALEEPQSESASKSINETIEQPQVAGEESHISESEDKKPTQEEPIVNETQTNNLSKTANYYDVVEIVDGDTIKINYNGTTESIRFIGIDTPETVHPSTPVQCFGIEASNKAKELMQNKKVRLEFDATQGERDKYNRLLAYVFLEDGTHINYKMIREGFAFEYTYNLPYKYMDEFKEAERLAREEGQGLWNSQTCNGSTEIINPSIPAGCDCNLTCTVIATCEDAYYQLNTCGCTGRDSDGDGVPCESTLCASNDTAPAPTSEPAPEPVPEPMPTPPPPPAPTPKPEPAPEPTPPPSTGCKYDCVSPDRDCGDFATHQEAVTFWNCCGFTATNDPMRLDGRDKDGIPCESLP